MNCLVKQLTNLRLTQTILSNATQHKILSATLPITAVASLNPSSGGGSSCLLLHTSSNLNKNWNSHNLGPRKWMEYNKIVHPPQQPDEEPRKAYVYHMRTNIKYSPDKMWYIASFIRGMTVDEAIKQLSFVLKKGAQHVKEVLEEARELAVKSHNVEYKTNLWVAESFVGKGRYFKGVRRHARGRSGRVEYKHCHYFVRLEEGNPPEHYYLPVPQTPQDQFDKWLEQMRKRKVYNSL